MTQVKNGSLKNDVKTPMSRFEKWSIGLMVLTMFLSFVAVFAGAYAAYAWFDPADKHGTFLLNAINLKCPSAAEGSQSLEDYDLNVEFLNVGPRPIMKSEIFLLHDKAPARSPTLEAGEAGELQFDQKMPGARWDKYVISTAIAKDKTLNLHAQGSFGALRLITDSGERISYYVTRPAPGKCYMSYPVIAVDVDVGQSFSDQPFDTASETTAHAGGASATSRGADALGGGKPNR